MADCIAVASLPFDGRCFHGALDHGAQIKGRMAMPYITIARGSSWVVRSCKRKTLHCTNSVDGLKYEIFRAVAREGHVTALL